MTDAERFPLNTIVLSHIREELDPFGFIDEYGAVMLGSFEKVDSALDAGWDINSPLTRDGETLLHIVARLQGASMCRYLLQRGAKVDSLDALGRTPLMSATIAEQVATVEPLGLAGADLSKACNGLTPLMVAASNGSLDTCAALVRVGAVVDERNDEHQTALHQAARRCKSSTLFWLLSQNADVDAQDIHGYTPLSMLCQESTSVARDELSRQIAQTMIELGANPDLADLAGQTPLHHACKSGCQMRTLMLLVFDVDQKVKDNSGRTASQLAKECGQKHLVQLISAFNARKMLMSNPANVPKPGMNA